VARRTRVRQRRFAGAAIDCGRLPHERGVVERSDHELRKVHTPDAVAGEDGVAHVTTPDRQPLTGSFLEVAAAHHGPLRVAGEDAATRLVLKRSEYTYRTFLGFG